MHAKILWPKTSGKIVYANTGSARRATNYLQKEAKENGQEANFFGSAGKVYTADEVVTMLNKNHKGLGKDEEKFHSLVFSPSPEEAAQLGNDPKALQQYTQDAMELYAKNFKLKNGKELGESDLVGAAVIHQERKNRGTDEGSQGEQKPSLQTHVHVVVSARDAAQKITLSPNNTADPLQLRAFSGGSQRAAGRTLRSCWSPRDWSASPDSGKARGREGSR